jgi:pyruvate dehydrogenase E2 component (dihydrolipoamide acetyltransferase)
MQEVRLPAIGDFHGIEVVEILVRPGDRIAPETPLLTLESDKASMEVPSPVAGIVREVRVRLGDRVSEGDVLLLAEVDPATAAPTPIPAAAATAAAAIHQPNATSQAPAHPGGQASQAATHQAHPRGPTTTPDARAPSALAPSPLKGEAGGAKGGSAAAAPGPDPAAETAATAPGQAPVHAGPAVRQLARELGVVLAQIAGSGRRGRIRKEDVTAFVKAALAGGGAFAAGGAGLAAPRPPAIDFSRFGPVEQRPLSRIRRLAGQHLSRSWAEIPHVTQLDEADITDLEAFRQAAQEEATGRGVKLTLLAFLVRCAAACLARYPEFNSSLAPDGAALILKGYCHIGVAVDTEAGLVVPVIRDVGRRGLFEIAAEIQRLGDQARGPGVAPEDIQGGCFTISSLGGIGGGPFTPIINPPEVAILGVSRAVRRPVYQADGSLAPRLVLPFALSYDHRVVDGVAGARFTTHLAALLADPRRLLL